MTENELAKDLLINNRDFYSDGINIISLDVENLKYEEIRTVNFNTFNEERKVKSVTTCRIGPVSPSNNDGVLFFDYYKTDSYQSQVKDDYVIIDLFKVNKQDLVRTILSRYQPILEEPIQQKIVTIDSFPIAEIIGFNCLLNLFCSEKILKEVLHYSDNLIYYQRTKNDR